jgi:medium-chain acyl-[acyl-carrier-protein] hydrolase
VSSWLPFRAVRPGVRLRLLCFPYAGGSASLYRAWSDALPEHIELCAVQLPGRETRLGEDPYTDMSRLVDDLIAAVEPLLRRPFALFGYSFGGAVAHEFGLRAAERLDRHPAQLFVCARRAPHLARRDASRHDIGEDELKAELHRLNGTPREVLENAELMELLLPALRADLELNDTYVAAPERIHGCPLTVFAGADDAEVSPAELRAWSELTSGACRLATLAGDHFFIRSRWRELLDVVVDDLSSCVG